MSFPRYPEYKDSGVEWLGKVPAHWVRSALKYLASYQNGHPFKPEDWGSDGRPIIRIAQLTGDADPDRFLGIVDDRVSVSDGDLLFSWSATLDSFFWHGEPAWLNQHIFKVAPTAEGCKEYLYYLIKFWAPKLADVDAHGSTMRHIKKESLGQRVYAPPIQEQAAIARFLDHETAKIDALIAEQQKLIALLKEKRQAVISHAVTKGLDPNVPMKDSGVEWLGEVPAHWEIVPLMWLTESARPIMYGIVLPGPDVEDGIPILKGGSVRPERLQLDLLARTTPEIEAPYARARLNAGDLVYSIRGTIGDCEIVPDALHGCNITQDVARIAPADGVDGRWLRFSLLSEPVAEELACGSLGAAVRGVNIYDLKRVRIPVPPHDERGAISAWLAQEVEELDRLAESADVASDLLKERRAALISAAVTGQIDVRGTVQLSPVHGEIVA